MRTLDKLGYLTLTLYFVFFFLLNMKGLGLFFWSMAATFFIISGYRQLRAKWYKKGKIKYIKQIVNSDLTDEFKIAVLGLSTGAELRRLEKAYKDKNE
jgi:hypothetical protein